LNVFASSNDSYFTIPGDNLWHYTDTRLKENTSYVYFKARSDGTAEYGEYYEVALDTGHGWDRVHTCSYWGTCSVPIFLTNFVFENYGPTNIRLAFRSKRPLTGVWSPDSVWEPNGIYVNY